MQIPSQNQPLKRFINESQVLMKKAKENKETIATHFSSNLPYYSINPTHSQASKRCQEWFYDASPMGKRSVLDHCWVIILFDSRFTLLPREMDLSPLATRRLSVEGFLVPFWLDAK